MRHDTTHGLTSDALAPGSPGAAPGTLAWTTPTAAHSLSANTRAAYTRALECRDVAPDTTAGAILVTVRRSKTEPDGTAADVRYLGLSGFPNDILGPFVGDLMGKGPVEARGKRAAFSKARWARSVRPRRCQLPQGPSVCDKMAPREESHA